MNLETIVGVAACTWLAGATVWMIRSVGKGRELADSLATRHPTVYEKLERPRPGFFESDRRRRWARFVGQREYQQLEDLVLEQRFEEFRRAGARGMIGFIVSLVVVGIGILWLRYAGSG